jgi:hypothetical protein
MGVFIKDIHHINEVVTFIEEHILNIHEQLVLGTVFPFGSMDIQTGDIIIPHTCI